MSGPGQTPPGDNRIWKLLSAAAQFQAAATDLVESARDGGVKSYDNVGSGETLTIAADGLRLLIDAMSERAEHEDHDEDANQLHGSLIRFLDGRSRI